MQKSAEEAEKVAAYYDYLEVQPPAILTHLIERELVSDELALRDTLKHCPTRRKNGETGGRNG